MTSFNRFRKLAGLVLSEAMSMQDAKHIFVFYGAEPSDLISPDALKICRTKLIKKFNPNVPGADQEPAKEINAAYDTLKLGKPLPEAPKRDNEYAGSTEGNYRDYNFFQQNFRKMAQKYADRKDYTIWNFDGKFFRGCISVMGAPELFTEMAKAMIVWDNYFKKDAIFITRADRDDLQLIYLKGKFLDGSITLDHESFNKNPSNDAYFVRSLPETLDEIYSTL